MDSSSRFILAADSPLLANLAALWNTRPELAKALEAQLERDSDIIVEPSKAGPMTARATRGGQTFYVHSRYQPIDEAKKLIDPLPTTEAGGFYCCGFGLGYHVQELFDRTGDETLLCVFEPDMAMLRAALETHDFSEMLMSPRLHWFHQADKGDFFHRLTRWQPLLTVGFAPVLLPAAMRLAPAFHQQMQQLVDEMLAYAKTNTTTLVLNSRRTAENLAGNVERYVTSPDVSRLRNAYKDKPAIIVSAGPSLRKNKHLLKHAQGKAVIIAVQTTLQPLLDMGIEPHFVTSLDYHAISQRFWEKLPKTLKTELVAEPKANGAVLDLSPGPVSITGNDFLEDLLIEMSLKKTPLPSGATVAHLAYYLAEHLGCNPIVFIGQDLGFSDGLCYTPGTSYEDVWEPELSGFCSLEMKQWEQIVRDRNILRRVPDYQGRPMYTEERLYTYLQHFERDFSRTKTTIIDATEGGVRKAGTQIVPLATVIQQYCNDSVVGRVPHPGSDKRRLAEALMSLENRLREGEEIERLSEATLPLLEAIRDDIQNQAEVNRLIAKIDGLRARMMQIDRTFQLVMQLAQKSELERFKADHRIAAGKLEGIERQQMQVQRDVDNVRNVGVAARDFQQLMQQTIERIERNLGVVRRAA